MPERISYAVLAARPITHDEYAAALKEVVEERVMRNRRIKADLNQDAALEKLAAIEAEADQRLKAAIAKSDAADAILETKATTLIVASAPLTEELPKETFEVLTSKPETKTSPTKPKKEKK